MPFANPGARSCFFQSILTLWMEPSGSFWQILGTFGQILTLFTPKIDGRPEKIPRINRNGHNIKKASKSW
jgi:hypothetical protein